MTPKEFEIEFDRRLRQLNIANLIYPVATKVRDDMQQRIFERGVNGSNKKIGTYSTTPAWFVKKQFKKTGAFRGRGKNSNKPTFKNGKPRRSMYQPMGYKGLKATQGYQNAFVNFSYSNQLRNQFGTRLAVDKNLVVLKLDAINANKTSWLEDKYGKQSFKHTEAEKDFFAAEVTKKLIAELGDA
jgi:hypothetical protein